MYLLHYILNIIVSIITKTNNLQQITDIYRDFYRWVNVAMDSFDSIHSFDLFIQQRCSRRREDLFAFCGFRPLTRAQISVSYLVYFVLWLNFNQKYIQITLARIAICLNSFIVLFRGFFGSLFSYFLWKQTTPFFDPILIIFMCRSRELKWKIIPMIMKMGM